MDGDTLRSPAGIVVRIANIDTAEMACRCARECTLAHAATAYTRRMVEGAKTVELRPYSRPQDRHGRTLAYVMVDGRDLGEMLVSEGLARRWTGRREPWC